MGKKHANKSKAADLPQLLKSAMAGSKAALLQYVAAGGDANARAPAFRSIQPCIGVCTHEEVIDKYDLVRSGAEKTFHHVAANKSAATGNEMCFHMLGESNFVSRRLRGMLLQILDRYAMSFLSHDLKEEPQSGDEVTITMILITRVFVYVIRIMVILKSV